MNTTKPIDTKKEKLMNDIFFGKKNIYSISDSELNMFITYLIKKLIHSIELEHCRNNDSIDIDKLHIEKIDDVTFNVQAISSNLGE